MSTEYEIDHPTWGRVTRKPIYETITKISHLGYQLRVWSKPSNSEMPRDAGDPSLITHLRTWAVRNDIDGIHTDPELIHDALVKMPEVTGFEITDGLGNGFMCHTAYP